jgi:hypothetical protein
VKERRARDREAKKEDVKVEKVVSVTMTANRNFLTVDCRLQYEKEEGYLVF